LRLNICHTLAIAILIPAIGYATHRTSTDRRPDILFRQLFLFPFLLLLPQKELTFREIVQVKLLVSKVGKCALTLAIDNDGDRFELDFSSLRTEGNVEDAWAIRFDAGCRDRRLKEAGGIEVEIKGTGLASVKVVRPHVVQIISLNSSVGYEAIS
jgi:hypothetical protein